MSGSEQQAAGGCATLIAAALIIAAVVAAVISIAALVDPFSSLPSVGEIFEECEEDYDTLGDDCELATRYPGFWPNVILSFAYVVVTVFVLLWLAHSVGELRGARSERFSGPNAVDRYVRAREALAIVAGLAALLAALPIVVAIA